MLRKGVNFLLTEVNTKNLVDGGRLSNKEPHWGFSFVLYRHDYASSARSWSRIGTD